eukprot:scaffold29517_cov17-Tisochrysis_lutea.AAC.1
MMRTSMPLGIVSVMSVMSNMLCIFSVRRCHLMHCNDSKEQQTQPDMQNMTIGSRGLPSHPNRDNK